jgi:uncharacterized protein DUF3293
VPLDPALLEAYRQARYAVFGERGLVLRIGEPNPDLDALLAAEGASTAAFITAANPRGEARSAIENRVASAALVESQRAAGYACYPGEGRDPGGKWTPEPSVLVVGIARENALALGRELRQNAIVFVTRGLAPELVVLAG